VAIGHRTRAVSLLQIPNHVHGRVEISSRVFDFFLGDNIHVHARRGVMTFVLVLVLEVEPESIKARLTVDVLEGSFYMNVERVDTLWVTVKTGVVVIERGRKVRKLPNSTY
jgi:hypothetical protein